MSILTSDEIRMILKAIHPEGFGYSKNKKIALLQTKLSMMLQLAVEDEQRKIL